MQGAFFKFIDLVVYLRHPRLMLSYFRNMGYWPQVALPRNFNEKFLWRKVFDHDPRFPECIDKLRSKQHVRARYPDVRLPETIWEGSDPAAIPDSALAGNCVVKANHGCGWNLLVEAGNVNRSTVNRKGRKWMRRRYYGRRRMEWGYRDIIPRLFVEEMVMDAGRPVDREYKCYIAGGTCVFVYMKVGRFGRTPLDVVFGPDGVSRVTRCSRRYDSVPFAKPENWNRIIAAAEEMGREFDSVRCDLYEIDGEIWFSEYTFYSDAGYDYIDWPEVYGQLGDLWDLRRSHFLLRDHKGLRQIYKRRLIRQLDADAALD
ncbi:teichuronopeptide biosynthesis TupA-like protein [Hoeflea marina]|uniref:Teichuronopeptide biosynthesis TupA-like protein n=2 Tax=Hoeflea marina TaxID=274592 RepID=A0A317PL23_9HYPH|nr:teichuronopeptide biosynthesis TupA-like protein [Hoeflea marina]